MLVLLSAAYAACGEEVARLAVGEHAWWVEGGTWEMGPSTVEFGRGFAFEVLAGGQARGIVYVGKAVQRGRMDPIDAAALTRAFRSELHDDSAPLTGGELALPVDVLWGLGSPAVPLTRWTPVEVRDGALMDVSQATPALLVVEGAPLRSALATARETLEARPRSLADAGYPLASVLSAEVPEWGMVDARTTIGFGALAGRPGAADTWIETFVDDVVLDGGRRQAVVSLGTRFVEGMSGG